MGHPHNLKDVASGAPIHLASEANPSFALQKSVQVSSGVAMYTVDIPLGRKAHNVQLHQFTTDIEHTITAQNFYLSYDKERCSPIRSPYRAYLRPSTLSIFLCNSQTIHQWDIPAARQPFLSNRMQ